MKRYRFPALFPLSASSVGAAAIAAVFIIAFLDFVGWMLDIPFLKSVGPQLTPMKVITAIGLLLSIAALACLRDKHSVRWKQRLSLASGAAAGAVGLLTAITYLVEIVTGHQWSWVNKPILHLFLAPSTRMAVITAFLFSLFGSFLLLLGAGNRRAAGAGHVVLLPVSMMSYLIIIGYLFNIRELYTWLNVSVALNTSIAFCCLCVAAFCIRPGTWFMHVFTSEEAGADMARRILPFLLLLPLTIGWLRLHGERYDIFGSEVGVAVVVVTYTVCFLLLLWLNARSVNRTDLLRRKAEKNVLISDKILNRAQEIAHLGSWELDLVNNRLFWSDEVYRIFGLPPQKFEATYEAFLETVHPDDRAAVDAAYNNSVREGKNTYEIEHRIVRKSTGEIRIVHEKCEHQRDETGKIIRSAGMVHDITGRKEAEEELKKAKNELELRVRERTADVQKTMATLETERQRFNDVLNMLPAYVFLLTPDYYIPFANLFFRERFGESGGKRCFEHLFGRNEPCETCEKCTVLKTMSPHEWEWIGPDGRNYRVFDFPFSDSDGAPLVLEMGIDITERKRAEAELIEANEMKLLGQLTSGVAHEVRNPLNGILAIMGALSKELSDNDRFHPYMQHMRNQVTRLTMLMEELLVLGRPLREENLNEISMVALVEETLTTWLQTLQSLKPSVQFIKPENQGECLIRADGTSMTQVIINFLENAFNHSPAGTEIICAVKERPPDHVVFSVKDRGTGIPEEILPKIFEPFFTTRKGGTGLGLSIVRRIVDNHHGGVIARNNTDGSGATFEVTLPLYIA
ncbi:MAG: PAS domain-containing protein [Chitinispirillaceae bacterium]|nr:PAS domain-containing protein [Chitinispirillaceae bacterium]